MSGILAKLKKAHSRIERTLDMAEFDEGYAGATFQVWMAPTRAHMREWGDLTEFITSESARLKRERANPPDGLNEEDLAAFYAASEVETEGVLEEWRVRQVAWYATTWGMSLEDVQAIREALQESNPLAWDWLLTRSSQMIGEYRREKLKKQSGG